MVLGEVGGEYSQLLASGYIWISPIAKIAFLQREYILHRTQVYVDSKVTDQGKPDLQTSEEARQLFCEHLLSAVA